MAGNQATDQNKVANKKIVYDKHKSINKILFS